MKQKILTGWNLMRGIYVTTGLVMIIQAAFTGQWLGMALGSYFVAMAVLRLGCASGSCFGGNCNVKRREQ